MILKAGDPDLTKVETEDSDIGSPAFVKDLNIMLRTLRDHGGMGLAAPQLGLRRRLLLIESKPNKRYPNAPQTELMVIINPRILKLSENRETGWEGCLSVPGKRVKINRPASVTFEYTDQNLKKEKITLTGFPARIFQHEYDHLEGITILDRSEGPENIISDTEYFDKVLPFEKP